MLLAIMQGRVIAGVAPVAGGGHCVPNCGCHSSHAVLLHLLERLEGVQNREQRHHGALDSVNETRYLHRMYVLMVCVCVL